MPRRTNLPKSSRLVKPLNTLLNLKTLPSNKDVLKRRKTLQNEYIGKPKSTFLAKLAQEIEEVWMKQDVPVQSWRVIYNKLQRSSLSDSNSLFDCIPKNPVWKTNEDKIYYFNQKHNLGGYCTSKKVSFRLHPSKQPRRSAGISETPQRHDHGNEMGDNAESTHNDDDDDDDEQEEEDDEEEEENDDDDEEDGGSGGGNDGDDESVSDFNLSGNPRAMGDVTFAELLRERANLSISQTIAVMTFYKDHFANLESIPSPPSRGSLSRASRRVATQISRDVALTSINQTLYFDMKQYTNLYGHKREIICICIDKKLVEFQELRNKKAATIAECLIAVIEKASVGRIVSDTEPTNTGSKNGVIVLINKRFPNIQYEPCRLHVLDLIIKHEMQHLLGKVETTGPQIPFRFVTTLQNEWSEFRTKYLQVYRSPVSSFPDLPANEDRRDDYRLLLELTKAVRTLKETGERRYVKIPRIHTSVSSARWNSKAIYSLMAELVMENSDTSISALNKFIAYQWAPVWFGVRDIADWSKLTDLSDAARNVLLKHGLINRVENKPPTNEFAERVFRLANEKICRCSSVETLRNALIRYVNDTAKLN